MHTDARLTLASALAVGIVVSMVGVGADIYALVATGPALTLAGGTLALVFEWLARGANATPP